MSNTIFISELELDKCGLSVWNQNKSNCHMLFRPAHTMTLKLANHREGTWAWYSGIEFNNIEAWTDFVKLVNDMDEIVKNNSKDEWGFPILEEE